MNLNSAMYMQSQPVRIASRSIIAAAAVMQIIISMQVMFIMLISCHVSSKKSVLNVQ